MIRLPPAVEPVKTTCLMRGSPTRIGPSTASCPVTTLSTPGGSLAAIWRSVITEESGVVGGGLTITVLPASARVAGSPRGSRAAS